MGEKRTDATESKCEIWAALDLDLVRESGTVPKPKISVLMAVHNGERYLPEAIDSVLGQTFADFEFLIVDDASVDGTSEIIAQYADQDERIGILRNPGNIGLTKSLNRGLRIACGEYVARQDADDVSMPDRLVKEVKVLDEQPDVVLVTCNIDLVHADGRIWRQPRRAGDAALVAWYLLFHNYIGGHSQVMFRRQPVRELGGYSETQPYSQDYELWLRLAEIGDVFFMPDALLQWRSHSSSITNTKRLEQEAYSLMNSGQAMARLLGEGFSLRDVAELRGFWLGNFPDTHQVKRLNARLGQLYQAFIQRRNSRGGNLGCQFEIRTAISNRYVVWARALTRRLQVFAALSVMFYAWNWRRSRLGDSRSHESPQ